MSEKMFKKGDRVVCVDAQGGHGLESGQEYTIDSVDFEDQPRPTMVSLKEKQSAGHYYARRFAPVVPAPSIDEEIAALEKRLNELQAKRTNAKTLEALEKAYAIVKTKFEEDCFFTCLPTPVMYSFGNVSITIGAR